MAKIVGDERPYARIAPMGVDNFVVTQFCILCSEASPFTYKGNSLCKEHFEVAKARR